MPRKEKKFHIIYKTTCKITGNFYVGMHSTNYLNDKYMGSGKRLLRSMDKHGWKNHVREILHYCDSRSELAAKEAEIINERFIENPLCMNLIEGGHGGWGHVNDSSEDHKNRCKKGAVTTHQINKQKLDDPEYRKKHCKRWSESGQKKIKEFYPEGTWKGKSHSIESKQKISKANSANQSGEKNSQFGTCWICKDFEVKKISKDNLQSFMNEGWKRGRK